MPLSGGPVDHASYHDHLSFMLSVHRDLEPDIARVDGLSAALPDLGGRWKADALRADLGDTLDEPDPRPDRLTPRSVPQALGVLYVLEGATLGGRVLLRRLRAHGIIPGPLGSRYLESFEASAGAQWRSLCRALEDVAPGRVGELECWAQRTFSAILGWRRNWARGIRDSWSI